MLFGELPTLFVIGLAGHMGLTTALKASRLLELNIDALLRARGQKRTDLAKWCRRSDGWLSKILSEDQAAKRGLPMKYLDRIADFFGIATYQLFQPGISPLTERRNGFDRRKLRDRRVSQAVLSELPGDVDLVHIVRALSREGRERGIGLLADILNSELRRPPARSASAAAPGHSRETGAAVRPPGRTGKARASG